MDNKNLIDDLWSSVGKEEGTENTSSNETPKKPQENLIDTLMTSAPNQEQEQPQEEEEVAPELNQQSANEEPVEEPEKNWFTDPMKSMASGILSTGAGLTRFGLEMNHDKDIYKDVIREYGSIEKAMEAEDPRALLAQNYSNEKDTFLGASEYLYELSQYISPEADMDIIQAYKDRRWEDLTHGLIVGVTRNIPDLVGRGIIIAKTGNPMLATSHVFGSVAGQKMLELEDNPNYSDEEKKNIAGIHGAIELIAERYGSTAIIEGLVNKVGMKPAKSLVTSALREGLSAFIKEGAEEGVTEFLQGATDYIFGLNPDWNLDQAMRDSGNAFVLGGATGLFMGGAGALARQVTPTTETNQQQEVETNQNNNSTTNTANVETNFDAKTILEATGDKTFDARVSFVQNMIDTGTKYAQEYGIDPKLVVALMGKESNFRHIESYDKSSTAFGAMQMNGGAMETVMDNYELQNDPNSVEGRIEAGVKYLHWIQSNYGMTGDSLIASYYAGVGEIITNGIHDNKIYGDSASPQQYLREYYNILDTINESNTNTNSMVHTYKPEVQQETNDIQSSSITPESEVFLERYFNDNMNPIELRDSTGEWSQEALSEFEAIRDEWGGYDFPIFTDSSNSEFTNEFKKALAESLNHKIETMEELGMSLDSTEAPELLKVLNKEGTQVDTNTNTNANTIRLYRGEVRSPEQASQVKTNLPNKKDLATDILGRDPLTEKQNELNRLNEALDDLENQFEETQDPQEEVDLLKKKEVLEEQKYFVEETLEDLRKNKETKDRKQETIEKSNFIYLTSQRQTAEAYAGNADVMQNNPTLYGEGEYQPTIHEYDVELENTLDLTKYGNEDGILENWNQVEELEQALGLSEEQIAQVESYISEVYGDIGASGSEVIPVYAFFRSGIVEHIQDNLENSGYDSIHYTEGNQDNYIIFDEAKLNEIQQAPEDTSEPIAEDTEYTERQRIQDTLDSLEDKRTSQARELKQRLKDLDFIAEFEKTDETVNDAYNRIQEELDQIDDKRTKKARELKSQLHALEQHMIDKMVSTELEVEVVSDDGSPSTEYLNKDVEIKVEINDNIKKLAQEYIRRKAEEGVEVSTEEAYKLATTAKPANGYAYNTTRVTEQNPEVLKVMQEIAEQVKSVEERTFDRIETEAEKSFSKEGKALQQELGLLGRDAKVLAEVMRKAPETVFKFKQLVTRSAQDVTDLAQELYSTMSTLSELELGAFANKVNAHFALTNDLKSIESNWGRTGVAMRHNVNGKMVNLESIDPKLYEQNPDAQVKVKGQIDSLGGEKALRQLIKDIANGDKDLLDLNNTIRKSTNKKFMRAILENMSISVLGDHATQLANMFSQAGNAMLDVMIDYASASINELFIHEESAMTFAKANAKTMAGIEGLINSFYRPIVSMRDAGKVMYQEDYSRLDLAILAFKDSRKFEQLREASAMDSRMKVELQQTHSLDMDTLFGDKGKDIPMISFLRAGIDYTNSMRRNATFGALQFGDAPFATEAYYRALAEEIFDIQRSYPDTIDGISKQDLLEGLKEKTLAYRKIKTLEQKIEYEVLKRAGAESQETQAEVRNEIYHELVGDVLDNVTPAEMEIINSIDQKSLQYSEEKTWKAPFEDGSLYRSVEKVLNAHPTLKVFGFLFYHTPMKIFERATDITFSKKLRTALSGKQGKSAQVQALGTIAVSYSLIAMSALMYLTNRMTPTPRDKRERELMRQAGVPANSVKINGKWFNFDRVEPTAYILSMGANGARAIHEALNDPDNETAKDKAMGVLADTIVAMSQTMLNKSSLTGVLNTVQTLVNGGAKGYFKGLSEAMNPTYSFKKNFTDYSYGGLNPMYEKHFKEDSGLVARDLFGKPIVNYKSHLKTNKTKSTDSPIRQEIFDLQMNLSGFGSVFNGVTLSDEQRNMVLEYFDEVIKAEDKMNQYVTTDRYKNMSIPQKISEIERRWTHLKAQAQIQLVRDSQFMEDFKTAKEKEKEDFLNNYEYPENMFNEGDSSKLEDIVTKINLFKRGD